MGTVTRSARNGAILAIVPGIAIGALIFMVSIPSCGSSKTFGVGLWAAVTAFVVGLGAASGALVGILIRRMDARPHS